MADLWKQVVPSILMTKKNVLLTDQDVSEYPPYMVNKALSYHNDCIFIANQMNLSHHLDKKVQYDFLMSVVRSTKRPFQKWATKGTLPKEVEAVARYYSLSAKKAYEAFEVMTTEEVDAIVLEMEGLNE